MTDSSTLNWIVASFGVSDLGLPIFADNHYHLTFCLYTKYITVSTKSQEEFFKKVRKLAMK